jgi:hypothetical protein
VLTAPIALGVLATVVTDNDFAVAAAASDPDTTATATATATVSVSGNTLMGATGVSSLNLNAAANSLQQTNVSVAVTSVY